MYKKPTILDVFNALCDAVKSSITKGIITGLIALNIATLIDSDIHNFAYNSLSNVLNSIVSPNRAEEILKNSQTKKLMEMRNKNIMKANAAKKISKRISSRVVKLAARNVAEVPVQLIPGIGDGAMLALTAWDVFDSCQTLKDMNELNQLLETAEQIDEATVCGINIPGMPSININEYFQ